VMALLREGLAARRAPACRRDPWRVHRHRHRPGAPAAGRPVPGAGGPGGRSAGPPGPALR
jgi:hypothetical protein